MPIKIRDRISSSFTLVLHTMDEICPIHTLNDDEKLCDGLTAELQCRLEELPNAIGHLTAVRPYGEEESSLLMVAAIHGHVDIVRLLLSLDAQIVGICVIARNS
jgi:hypothetical protein